MKKGIQLKSSALFSGAEVKQGYSGSPLSFYNFLNGGSLGDLRALEAIRLYKRCMPFFRAVEMRAEAFSSIPIRIKDTSTGEFVDSHPALDLIGQGGKPNPAESLTNFLKGYSTFRDVTGQSFLIASGMRGRDPQEILNAKPQEIIDGTVNQCATQIYDIPGSYMWNTDNFNETYSVDPVVDDSKTFRYWNKMESRELWASGEFNPTAGSGSGRGMSKAAPISAEIQQFIEGNTNNLSVLKRGARPSVAWVSQLDEPLTEPQYERWKEQVLSYEGALNAGKQILVDAVEPKVISTTNKDMEFKDLKQAVRTDIFVEYQIPLALVSPEQMTLDNLKTSVFQLFDLSVLPHADNLLEELTLFLMPRYKNSENLVFTYNPVDIEPLKERALEQTSKLQKIMIATDNELRSKVGMVEIEGGDSVFKPMNQVPSDETGTNQTSVDNAKALASFEEHCREIKKPCGERSFSDVEIDIMAKEQNLK